MDEQMKRDVSRRDFLRLGGVLAGTSLLASTQLNGLAEACGARKKLDKVSSLRGLVDPVAVMPTRDFSYLVGNVPGFSKQQLQEHIGLYEKYVKKYNAATAAIERATLAGDFSDLRTLQKKQSYALNGAILHDGYFGNMATKDGVMSALGGTTVQVLSRDFGTTEKYFENLMATAKKMRGWVVTGFNMKTGRVANYGLDAHDVGTPMCVKPLVVLDVYEHAYMIDFGTNRSDYLAALKPVIAWDEVEKRVQRASKHWAKHAKRRRQNIGVSDIDLDDMWL